jgi:hypothetical protein
MDVPVGPVGSRYFRNSESDAGCISPQPAPLRFQPSRTNQSSNALTSAVDSSKAGQSQLNAELEPTGAPEMAKEIGAA